ncbi:MAG: hypothetical protein LBB53_02395 [Prevotellaceae bacterium]|jgi:hypothetical protein|nr:hypothetical protein [Prevotellaceae bacterium]
MAKVNIEKVKSGLSFLDELSPKRMLTLLIIIVVIVLIALFGVKIIKSLMVKIKGATNTEVEDSILGGGGQKTYTDAEYTRMAGVIKNAFGGIGGDDEQAIYGVLQKMRTKTDVIALVNAYGVQDVSILYGNHTLPEQIIISLSSGEVRKCNQILENLGIDYAF